MTDIVLVKKTTALEDLLRRHTTLSQAKFYLESRGDSYAEFKSAHEDYHAGLAAVAACIPKHVRHTCIDKTQLPTYQFGEQDCIVAVGDDGLLVNLAKYTNNNHVLLVNPDPKRFDGVLASCTTDGFPALLNAELSGRATTTALTMAEAKLDDGQILYALNDIYIGRKTHVSSRYELMHKRQKEAQSSDGLLITTGTGSTGWYTSIMNAAHCLSARKQSSCAFSGDAPFLVYTAMNPFPTKVTGTSMMQGRILKTEPLRVRSRMAEQGVIFGDGVEDDYLEFNTGSLVTITPAEKKLYVVKNING
ncbi:MAG: hypothetical protein V1725_04730 [archaeon]